MTDTARMFSQTVKKTTETIDDLSRIQSKEFSRVCRTVAPLATVNVREIAADDCPL